MKIENFFAFKLIKENKRNKDVFGSSVIVVTLISLAIVFFIAALSIMNGFIYNVLKIALEVKTFHIDCPSLTTFSDPVGLRAKIREVEEVKYADFYRETKVLLNANGINTGLIYFRTIPEDIFKIDDGFNGCIRMTEGNKSLGKNEIMISRITAEKLRTRSGSFIHLVGTLSGNKAEITLTRLKVSGIFTTGYQELDEQIAFVGNKTGDDIFKDKLRYNVFVKLFDYKNSEKVAKIFSATGIGFAYTWQDLNHNEISSLAFQKNIIAFIVIMVILMATFNILTTIYIIIHEKKESIGILKAIGYSPGNVTRIFLLNGIYLGFISIVIGVVAGLFLMSRINEILVIISEAINFVQLAVYKTASLSVTLDAPEKIEIFSKDFYLDRIYTEISFFEIFMISFLTLIFTVVSSIIPALRAGKIKPYEVLKNE